MTPTIDSAPLQLSVADHPKACTVLEALVLALTATSEAGDALARAVDELGRNLGATRGQLWLLDDHSTFLTLRASFGWSSSGAVSPARTRVAGSWIGAIARDGVGRMGALAELDGTSDGGTAEVGSAIGQPVEIAGRSIGALVLFYDDHVPLAAHRSLPTAARLLALSLDHGRLAVLSHRFEDILDATPDLVTIAPVHGSPLYINPSARKALGIGATEEIESLLEFRPPGFETFLKQQIFSAAAREGAWRGQSDYVTRDGDVIRVSQVSVAHYDRDGELKYLSTISRDITAEAAKSDDLHRSEERTRFALEAAKAGVWENDLEAGRVVWSETMRAVQGFDAEEFGGTFESFRLLVHPDDRKTFDDALRHATETRGDFKVTCRTLWPDGSVHWVESHGRVIADDAGRPTRILGMSQDVTQREILESNLRQSQRLEALGQLAGGVAHDFNNLLTVMLGYSTLLAEQLDEADPRRRDIEEVQHAAYSASQLTRQLLAFGRKQVLRPRLVSVNELISDTSRMLGRLVGENIEVATRLQADLPQVKADPNQLEQILVNLAVNARDAMPRGGTLRIRTRSERLDVSTAQRHGLPGPGDYVALSVIDTGIGMDEATKKRIFEPFFTTKEQGKGTGLGLATVFGIVVQSGGTIAVESTPGHGAEFTVRLPAVIEEVATEAPEAAKAPRGSETVLLVEDDTAVRRLAEVALQRLGYQVVTAATPEEALALSSLATADITLLVSDVIMPGLTGPELYERLRTTRPRLRVLFVSGFAPDTVACHGALTAESAFLQKPFTGQDLGLRVREVLDREN